MQNKSTSRAVTAKLQSDRNAVRLTYGRTAVNLTYDSDPFGVNTF
jgi:hypothetical protein